MLLYQENSPKRPAPFCRLTLVFSTSSIDRHFDRDTIAYIVKRWVSICVVTDSEAGLHRLIEVQKQTGIPLKIFVTDPLNRDLRSTDFYLGEACSQLSPTEADEILAKQAVKDVRAVRRSCLPRSTGEPKGFRLHGLQPGTSGSHGQQHCRGSGVMQTVLLSALVHNLGRYLEMMGMNSWATLTYLPATPRGRLLKRLAEVQPTGRLVRPRWRKSRSIRLEQLDPGSCARPMLNRLCLLGGLGPRLRWLSCRGFFAKNLPVFFTAIMSRCPRLRYDRGHRRVSP